MSVLTRAESTRLPIPEPIDSLPPEVQEVIEREIAHIDGPPTKETIETLCKELIINAYRERVLRYFLMESPLNLQDLRPLVLMIGAKRAADICQGAAATRLRHERLDWKPRWPNTLS